MSCGSTSARLAASTSDGPRRASAGTPAQPAEPEEGDGSVTRRWTWPPESVTVNDVARASDLARVAAERTTRLLRAVRQIDKASLEGPSQLPGWSRLTIVCHLRYGTHALRRMTQDALAGRETSYYPEGRDRQRPSTLVRFPGEGPCDVVNDWEAAASSLDWEWSAVEDVQWGTEVLEPAGNPDLGTIPLARLALARLTEVDVHGTDLGIGAADWSPTLVEVGLPTRLRWLSTRRTNHRAFDRSIEGAWLLNATDGPRWLVSIHRGAVESRPARETDDARAVIEGSSRDLFALLLGRPRRRQLRFRGDVAFAASFEKAFPGP